MQSLRRGHCVATKHGVSVRTVFTSEHFQRRRPSNKDKWWGRIFEEGEGVTPGRGIARIRNIGSIWPGANVTIERKRWENMLVSQRMGQVRYHTEVVDGNERLYVSVDPIYHPYPKFVLKNTIHKEENLQKVS